MNINPITQRTLGMFVDRVRMCEQDNLSKIVLFGSVARGEASEKSDIDVLVILKERTIKDDREIVGISVDVMMDMDFDENAYLQLVDLSEHEASGADFYELMHNISKEGVVLYDSQGI